MYKVLTTFTDLQDNNYKYSAGDSFPRQGLDVSEERLEELSTDKNRRHMPVIELVEDAVDENEQQDEEKSEKPKKGRKKVNA